MSLHLSALHAVSSAPRGLIVALSAASAGPAGLVVATELAPSPEAARAFAAGRRDEFEAASLAGLAAPAAQARLSELLAASGSGAVVLVHRDDLERAACELIAEHLECLERLEGAAPPTGPGPAGTGSSTALACRALEDPAAREALFRGRAWQRCLRERIAPGILRRQGRLHDLEDACAEAEVAVLAALPGYDPERRFTPFAHGIARNRISAWCRGERRREARVRPGEVDAAPAVGESPSRPAALADDVARVEAALRDYPGDPRHVEAFRRHEVQGHPYPQIARDHGVSPEAVRQRVEQVRGHVRARLRRRAVDA